MLKRKMYHRLLKWKDKPNKKAMCIFGARQIGKTTVVREFGKNEYENFVEINFLEDVDASKIFEGSLDIDTLITNLTAYTMKSMEKGKTLIFFDEIQACPNARTAIKFLVEDGRFDYIESGSLLGVKFKEARSFPVGFEEICYMYPMDFEEYLIANGVKKETIDYLESCFKERKPVTESVHSTLLKLFYTYIVVGGMPDAVKTYVETHDIAKVIESQKNILELYRLDIAQYADKKDKVKIKDIFDSIPSQLDDKNRRFILTSINANARQLRYEDSFRWLSDAGVALPCYNVNEPQMPLKLNEKHNLFKLYMGDTGLLCAACMANIQFGLLNGNMEINMGSILENIIAQQLISNGFNLNYFDKKKFGELDFILKNGMNVDLMEVKSGNDYHSHTALNKVMKVDQWKFGRAFVLCKGNIEVKKKIEYLPWYMIMFIKPEEMPDEMIFKVDLNGL